MLLKCKAYLHITIHPEKDSGLVLFHVQYIPAVTSWTQTIWSIANRIKREQDKPVVVFSWYVYCPRLLRLTAQGLSELEVSISEFQNLLTYWIYSLFSWLLTYFCPASTWINLAKNTFHKKKTTLAICISDLNLLEQTPNPNVYKVPHENHCLHSGQGFCYLSFKSGYRPEEKKKFL